MTRLLRCTALALLAGALWAAVAWAATPAENLQALSRHVDAALQQLQAGNVAGAQTEFKAFNDGWFGIEDGIRSQDRPLYRQIEDRMVDVQAAFSTQPLDVNRVQAALEAQKATNEQFVQRYGSGPSSAAAGAASPSAASAGGQTVASPPDVSQAPVAQLAPAEEPAATNGAVTMADEVRHLDDAQSRIAVGDGTGAAAAIRGFIRDWPRVEGVVATKAPDIYSATENKMAQAYGLLTSTPPRLSQASALIGDIKAGLLPFAEAPVRYTIFDAAIILLREGFEALLVVAALLAFLQRSNNADKCRWIWAGGGAGLALSAVIAVIVNVAFGAAGGSSRELLEGVTGLVAAAMLIWMMFWLHSRANLGAWNRYISQSAGRAVATNSLVSLALIAFLAVLREGAETVLFYLGIAPAIRTSDLFAGLAIGGGALIVVATLMLVLGVRIPIRPFFLATSILVFFLAFKFTGFGVHSLQVSGHLASHTAPLPAIGFVGLFPSWEPTALQALLLGGVALALLLTSARHDHAEPAPVERPSRPDTGLKEPAAAAVDRS